MSDSFPFVDRNRRVTNAIDLLILDSFRDFNLSASQIAIRFNVSDTYAIRVFDRYVDLPRLKLTSALCIDEVDLSIGRYKYALVIQDFFTGESVDMVISRRKVQTVQRSYGVSQSCSQGYEKARKRLQQLLSIYATGFCLQCVRMRPYLHHLKAVSRYGSLQEQREVHIAK